MRESKLTTPLRSQQAPRRPPVFPAPCFSRPSFFPALVGARFIVPVLLPRGNATHRALFPFLGARPPAARHSERSGPALFLSSSLLRGCRPTLRGISLVPRSLRHSPLPPQKNFVIPNEARLLRSECFYGASNLLFLPDISTFNFQPSTFNSLPPPRTCLCTPLPINVNLSIHDHRNVLPVFQKLHNLFALPSHLRPSRFGIRVLFQAAQFSILKTEIHLL